MTQGTFRKTINGFVNLMTLLQGENYQGTARLSVARFYNGNAAPVFINLTNDGKNAPADGTVGFEIGSAAPAKSVELEPMCIIDAGLIWLYAANPAEIKILVIGD